MVDDQKLPSRRLEEQGVVARPHSEWGGGDWSSRTSDISRFSRSAEALRRSTSLASWAWRKSSLLRVIGVFLSMLAMYYYLRRQRADRLRFRFDKSSP